jgi:REP element-mobilizing transposase RayT
LNWPVRLAGKKNGELLLLAEADGFEVFITLDHGIAYQQNFVGPQDRRRAHPRQIKPPSRFDSTRCVLDVLQHYRLQKKYLHEFVVMPDHFHLLLTPTETLERALQLIKGGFSYRARKELASPNEIWQPSYYDRRVRDMEEYVAFSRIHSPESIEEKAGEYCLGISLQLRTSRVRSG